MFCPHCGKHIEEDSEFCKHCGNEFSQEVDVVTTSEKINSIKTEGNKKITGILFIVAGILSIFIVPFILINLDLYNAYQDYDRTALKYVVAALISGFGIFTLLKKANKSKKVDPIVIGISFIGAGILSIFFVPFISKIIGLGGIAADYEFYPLFKYVVAILISACGIFILIKIKIEKKSEKVNIVTTSEKINSKIIESKKKFSFALIFGPIIMALGIYLSISSKAIAVVILGRDKVFKEALFGGNSLNDAAIIVLIGSIIVLIVGIILLISGIKKQVVYSSNAMLRDERVARSSSIINKTIVNKTREKIKCQNCGELNPEDSKFCNSCAKPLLKEQSEAGSSVICPSCNNENDINNKFCNNCGVLVK